MSNFQGQKFIVIGAGGHAKVVVDTLLALGADVLGCTDAARKTGESVTSEICVIGTDKDIADYKPGDVALANGIGSVKDKGPRQKVFEDFRKKGYDFPPLVHPAASVSPSVILGAGSAVMAGAVINTRASVDHDCIIGDHSHIAPGATLSGGVTLGERVHVGTGSNIIENVEIAADTLIGAGLTVKKNITQSGTTVKEV